MRKNQRSSYTRHRVNRYMRAKLDEHYRRRRREDDPYERNKRHPDWDGQIGDLVWEEKSTENR